MPKSLTEFSLLLLVLLLVAVACTTERVVEVTVERAVKVVETVIVDRPFEVPVPQTVIVEKEITVEVPVEREIRVVETVLVQREVTRVVTVAPVSTATSDASTPDPATKAAPAAKQPEPPISGQDMSGEVIIAVRRVEGVDGLPTAGPSHWSTTVSGGVEEYLFHYGDGDPMTPELVETWDIDPRGERVRLTMKRGPEGTGIPFNPPFGYEDLNFGVADADAVVRYLNETNANVNYDTAFGDSGDIAAIFREAHKIDDWTVEIGLVSPIFYCLPLSQFGCLSAARGLFYLAHGDSMGVEWAEEHHIGTGSLVQIACDEGQRCNTFAIKNHWRKAPEFSEFIQIQVADENTRIAMLRNSEVDMAVLDFSKVPGVIQEGYRFLETMPSGFIGQSILFPGNLWEHSHARTGDALKPWSCDKDDPNALFLQPMRVRAKRGGRT